MAESLSLSFADSRDHIDLSSSCFLIMYTMDSDVPFSFFSTIFL